MNPELVVLADAVPGRRLVPESQAAALLGATVVQVRRLISNGTLYQHPGTGGVCADMVLRLALRLDAASGADEVGSGARRLRVLAPAAGE